MNPLFKKLFTSFIFLTITVGIASCNLPGFNQPEVVSPETSNLSQETPSENALITFYVEVPPGTPSGEPIILSVLDEVTGLALNPKRFPMEAADETHYYLGLPVPVGTTIKYRYARQGSLWAEEHTSDGRPVRYRMVHVEAPGEVKDVISRWNDTTFDGPHGRISGTVLNIENQAPLAGMLVAVGGAQAMTAGDGSFLIEGLPPGTHNLVVYAPDGKYRTFQQGALVADASTTPAVIQLNPTTMVDVTFIVHPPEGTPPTVPIRLAGNLYQLGNTFANLSGGISTLASRMPVLAPLPDGSYGIILALPVGADVRYKYTIGDGFWNTERASNGNLVVRQMIVPDTPTVRDETVETWHVGEAAPITFDITAPENTPPDETIYIQFNPYGWTEPLPMWHLGGQRWAYILYSPLDMLNKLGYRYCRAGQCGHADDTRTPGVFTSGQVVETAKDPQGIPDQIPAWLWLEDEVTNPVDVAAISGEGRGSEFMAGVEIQERYHPSWEPIFPAAFENISNLNANWTVLTPGWTFTRSDPPVLEPVAGQDADWQDTVSAIQHAKSQGLEVALRPVAHFPTATEAWWQSAPRDFSWWVSWFDRYEAFAIHHAQLAEQNDIPVLILGGDWMAPAMPGSIFSDDSPTGVPPDAELRYRELIAEIREHFSGTLGWAITYPDDIDNLMGFLTEVDLLYVLWSAPLSGEEDAPLSEMQAAAEAILADEIYPAWLEWELNAMGKQIVFSLGYPSVDSATTGCLPDPIEECIRPEALNFPAPDYPLLNLNLEVQATAYQAMLAAINTQSWISGVVSRGYYPPTILQDKSTSIHGKPAEEVLQAWFEDFTQPAP